MKTFFEPFRHKSFIVTPLVCCIILLIFGCGGGSGGQINNNSQSAFNGSLTLTWDAPSADLEGYRIYYGTSPGRYSYVLKTARTTVYTISNLSPDTWCFVITAYNAEGRESDYSNEVCDTIQAGILQ